MNSQRSAAIEMIETFLAESGLSERRFCISAVKDHKFLSRLKAGAGITLTTIERAEAFIAEWRRDHDADCAA